jgi:hypothetical protein
MVVALTASDEADLRRLVAAADEGIALGRDFPLSTATRLEMSGFARIKDGRHFRAFATGVGKAHTRRTAS